MAVIHVKKPNTDWSGMNSLTQTLSTLGQNQNNQQQNHLYNMFNLGLKKRDIDLQNAEIEKQQRAFDAGKEMARIASDPTLNDDQRRQGLLGLFGDNPDIGKSLLDNWNSDRTHNTSVDQFNKTHDLETKKAEETERNNKATTALGWAGHNEKAKNNAFNQNFKNKEWDYGLERDRISDERWLEELELERQKLAKQNQGTLSIQKVTDSGGNEKYVIMDNKNNVQGDFDYDRDIAKKGQQEQVYTPNQILSNISPEMFQDKKHSSSGEVIFPTGEVWINGTPTTINANELPNIKFDTKNIKDNSGNSLEIQEGMYDGQKIQIISKGNEKTMQKQALASIKDAESYKKVLNEFLGYLDNSIPLNNPIGALTTWISGTNGNKAVKKEDVINGMEQLAAIIELKEKSGGGLGALSDNEQAFIKASRNPLSVTTFNKKENRENVMARLNALNGIISENQTILNQFSPQNPTFSQSQGQTGVKTLKWNAQTGKVEE